MSRAADGGDDRPDGSASRPSKNNRQDHAGTLEPPDLPGPALRAMSVRQETGDLRDEARAARFPNGEIVPVAHLDDGDLDDAEEIQARPTHRVVNEWRSWMRDYENSHIEFENAAGEVRRAQLENSYQSDYARRYYARLKDAERGLARRYSDVTTVMLTFTASHENADGGWRCPADHIHDVRDGWDTARKQLPHVLDGYRWEYARIMEPHKDGYGHLHVAVFVETDALDAETFRPVMRSYVGACESAGSAAHGLDTDGLGDSVSVSDAGDIDNLASYITEYLGAFADGSALERPAHEQMFYAITWATNSRRLDFSNGMQDIIAAEEFRRETGLRPEDRGRHEARERYLSPDTPHPLERYETAGYYVGDGEPRERAARDAATRVVASAWGPPYSSDPNAHPAHMEGYKAAADAVESAVVAALDTDPDPPDADGEWQLRRMCTADPTPQYYDPTGGGSAAGPIDGRPGDDPRKQMD